MKCQRCAQRDATAHLVELAAGRRRSRWLCAQCAGSPAARGGQPEDGDGDDIPDHYHPAEDDDSLAEFLGHVFELQGDADRSDEAACPRCGYTLDQFRRTNRLGCPGCYEAFRKPLLAILGHFHRHVSHLGKSPLHHVAGDDRPGMLSRMRVALEKAIAAEDFEKAARLRDEIQRLEAVEPPQEGG